MLPKLVGAEDPFALIRMVRHHFDAVDPWHPFDNLLFVSPKIISSFYRYTHVHLSTACGMPVVT